MENTMVDVKDALDEFQDFDEFDSFMRRLEDVGILTGWTDFMKKKPEEIKGLIQPETEN